ncbi:MAG: FixH family protein [Rhizobiales bacterium]|nr:FixH family protein [Hyphomicrobiales bacterium]
MTIQTPERQVREFTGRHMLIILICFFGVIITMNLTFAWLALGSWPGLLEQNGYQGSQSYNSQIAESRIQRELRWRSEISFTNGNLELTIKTPDGAAVPDLEIIAAVGRPTHELENSDIQLVENGGAYAAAVALEEGQWVIAIRARLEGDVVYRRNFRIRVRGGAG